MTYTDLPQYRQTQQKIVDEYERAQRSDTDINYALVEQLQKQLYKIKTDCEQPAVGITSISFEDEPAIIKGSAPKIKPLLGIGITAAAATILLLVMNR